VICTGEDGREAVRLVLAAYRSADAGQPVRVEGVADDPPREAAAGS
jgi:hypothetical protein